MPTHLSSSPSHARQPPVMRKRRPAPKPAMLRRTLASLLATTILPLATCQFTSPAAGAVLSAGDKVNVSYTTDLKNYTIALWQRAEGGGLPRLGSVVYGELESAAVATRLGSTRPFFERHQNRLQSFSSLTDCSTKLPPTAPRPASPGRCRRTPWTSRPRRLSSSGSSRAARRARGAIRTSCPRATSTSLTRARRRRPCPSRRRSRRRRLRRLLHRQSLPPGIRCPWVRGLDSAPPSASSAWPSRRCCSCSSGAGRGSGPERTAAAAARPPTTRRVWPSCSPSVSRWGGRGSCLVGFTSLFRGMRVVALLRWRNCRREMVRLCVLWRRFFFFFFFF